MIDTPRGRRWLFAVVAALVGAVVILLLIITLFDLEAGDKLASVIAAICGLVSGVATFRAMRLPAGLTFHQVLEQYAGELSMNVNAELHMRGLEREALLPLRIRPAAPSRNRRRAVGRNGATTWSSKDVQERTAASLPLEPKSRAIVFGEPGSGKTTTTFMVAAGLLENRDKDDAILLLQLDTWDGVQTIDDWLERQLVQSYPSLRLLGDAQESISRQLVYRASLTVLLDNFDAVPAQSRENLVQEISKFFPELKHRVILFSRFTDDRAHESLRRSPVVLHLEDCQADAVAALFTSRAKEVGSTAAWAPVIERLREEPGGGLAKALATPWHATLAWEVYSAPENTPEQLLSIADRPVREIVSTLHDRFLRAKCEDEAIARFPRAIQSLQYVAHKMQKLGVRNVAWWRLYEALPNWVLMAFVGLSVAPAYQLALHLPQGLTRGFAIGSTAGVCLGMLRGISTTAASGIIAAACTLPVVALIGSTVIGLPRTVTDIAQITVAVGFVVAWKEHLVTGRWATLIRILSIGLLTAAAVELTILAGIRSERGFLGVLLSTTLGLGVAVLAFRLLSDPSTPQQPSRVTLGGRRRWDRLPADLITGVVASVPVGVAGGVAGAIQQRSISYGVAVALVFGVTAGIPIGLVGGAIRWIRTATTDFPATTDIPATTEFPAIAPLSSLRNDRSVALTCIAAVGLASTFSIVAFGDVLRAADPVVASGLTVAWYHGLMFGLSLGLVIACAYTAWPAFFVYHLFLFLGGHLPWRFGTFFEALHEHGVLRRDGALYQFHQESLQDYLDECWHRNAETEPCAPADPRPHGPAYHR
ncbi:hypothetical protein AB0M02_27450 [Actinoplanes sp. NPDC051861]|uniref:hypothetical protein n=1 Tax=Actinoplanes sp. NPDC051861 TaxID=3155170 RepID=UPI0034398CB3